MEHYVFIASAETAPLYKNDPLPKWYRQKDFDTYFFQSPLENQTVMIAKRVFDVVFSSFFILVLLSWLIPLIAFIIKLDSKGPVFFFQKRSKRDGKPFTCIKFRTMIQNSEADIQPAIANDHRITRLGKILRKYHIDELPQLFNVWIGDMSVIGPRPYMLRDNQRFSQRFAQYELRFKVKPGITGLAQCLGYHGVLEHESLIKERTLLDLLYIKHWSVLMDLQIIFCTFCMIIGQGKQIESSLLKKLNC